MPGDELGGTVQNDILKEYVARGTYIYPAAALDAAHHRPVRLLRASASRAGTRSRSRGYHIREAGATAVQEIAFTLANGIAYVRGRDRRRALASTTSAPRLSFFFNAHNDFFEEVAKFRAARRMWARIMRERFGAKNRGARRRCGSTRRPAAPRSPRSSRRTTSSGSRCRRWPRCWAARSRSTRTPSTRRSALPTEQAATIALRTQQVIGYESRRRPTRPIRSAARTSSSR